MEISQIINGNGTVIPCSNQNISDEILKQSAGKLEIRVRIPLTGITGIWHPAAYTVPPMTLPWNIEFPCGANLSFPLLVFMDQNAGSTCAAGLTNAVDDCFVSCKLNQELCCYDVTFTIAVTEETAPFEIFLDKTRCSLWEIIDLYRQKLLIEVPAYPAGAWSPVYCTWYAVHTALTPEYLRSNAREAAALGFGTFIVDDGWCFDENKRVTPETLPDWYRDIGDWQLSEEKLPDMKETVQLAQEAGWNYLFWTAPFLIGRRSKISGKVQKYLTDLHEGQRILDLDDQDAAALIDQNILKIFREMALDGLKIDFLDTILPDVDAPRCRKVKRYLENLIGELRKISPALLIEFRQKYATPLNIGLATAFRAADAPFDYLENFNRCIQLRLMLGDGIPVHADPVYFTPDEPLCAVGRHMIASLAGVPMLSMELNAISAEHRQVIKNHIDLYDEHRETFSSGHWSFEFTNGLAAIARCTGKDEKIIILTDSHFLTESLENAEGKVILLNLTAKDLPFSGKTFDAAGRPADTGKIPSGGRGELCR